MLQFEVYSFEFESMSVTQCPGNITLNVGPGGVDEGCTFVSVGLHMQLSSIPLKF